MKKLLIALVAAVAVSTVFARITTQQGFESDMSGFEKTDAEEDASAPVTYAAASISAPSADPVPYPFTTNGFGSSFLDLDTGDTTLWCTNSGDATYFDMFMQFNPCATAPDIDGTTKLAVFLDSTNNLVVISSGATNVTGTTLAPGTWGRLTIAATNNQFTVLLNGAEVGSYASRTGDATVQSVGFKGTGALENYVARTTDPFLQNPAVSIDGEGYASLADAWADNPTDTPQLETDISLAAPLAYGESISVKLNNHTLSGITTGSLIALESTSGDVTTYTANYFPRTATAGQDGSVANPYEIADADDLVALQDAVLADAATFASKSYVQTANIDMTGVEGFWGIGWFTSSDAKDASITASGNVKFTGVYDGNNKTLSNVSIVRHNYAGIFNCIEGATIKDLVVSNVTFSGTCSEEGFAVVGNAYTGSTIANVTSAGTWPASMRHNAAGIVVRAQGNTTISGCVNNVALSTTSKRLGGILSFAGTAGTVSIQNCTNNAALVSTDGTRGVGGIVGSPEAGAGVAAVVISGCADFGSETAGESGYAGAIVGSLWSGTHTYTDDGGNTYPATSDVCGYFNGKAVHGLAYVLPTTIAETAYLTTVAADAISLTTGESYYTIVDGGYTFTAVDGTTLNFTVDTTTYSTSTLTLDVPTNVTVTIDSATKIGGVSVLTGSGRIVSSYSVLDLRTLVQQNTWCGTLEVRNASWTGQQCSLSTFGNSNSTFCANYVFFAPSLQGNNIKALEIGQNGLVLDGVFANGEFSFPCDLTGSGKLTVKVANSQSGTTLKKLIFTGDVSRFTGSVEIDNSVANCAVYFGNSAGNGNCISVAADKSVTVAAGKTWTAPAGFVVQGNMTVDGTLSTADKVYGNGTVRFTSAAGNNGVAFGGNWSGTYYGMYYVPYQSNAGATFGIMTNVGTTNVINGVDGKFFGTPAFNGSAPTVNAPVILNADWVISNGYSTVTTTFATLSGSGDLIVDSTASHQSGGTKVSYSITTLDNYTGTLGGVCGGFTIGKVSVDTDPAEGARVVATAIGANGSINSDIPLWVGGSDSGKVLEYKADGANGEGLYVKASAPVVPEITPGTSGSADCGSAAAAAVAADAINAAKATYINAPEGVTGTAADDYAECFTARADGQYVVVELNAAGTNALEIATTNASAQVATNLSAIAATAAATSVNITGATPGFYYSVVYSANLSTLDSAGTEGTRALAGSDGSVTLPIPAKASGATAGFYRVKASIKASDE